MKTKIKLAVAEDSRYNLNLLKATLNPFAHVVTPIFASNGNELLNQVHEQHVPDVVLMDIKMPEKGGIQTTLELLKLHPHVKVLAYTLHDNEELIDNMLQAGAIGYVFKSTPVHELIEIIEQAHQNKFNQHSDIYAGLFTEFQNRKDGKTAVRLTKKELEILLYICSGLINKEIAQKMTLKDGTINTYRHALLEKTNSKNTADLVCFAIEQGLYHASQNAQLKQQ